MNRLGFPISKFNFFTHRSQICLRFLSSQKKPEDLESGKSVSNLKKNSKPDVSKVSKKSLEQKAETFKSIGPNEKNTINKTTAKPKTFIRQSARPKEKVQIKDNVESINDLARGLDKRLVDAARRIAHRIPNKQLAQQTERQLLESVHKQEKENLKAKNIVKEDITKSITYKLLRQGAKVDQQKLSQEMEDLGTSSKIEKISLDKQSSFDIDYPSRTRRRGISLHTGECLSIFDPKGIYLTDLVNRNIFWEKLAQKELELALGKQLENFFEEQIKWTEEGKLWRFPINNEQGLESEESVPFHEHVLLDNLLVEFPQKGPVRQFMELVIMGLSQNPHITVERKHETIRFYKDFFQDKKLLTEVDEVEE